MIETYEKWLDDSTSWKLVKPSYVNIYTGIWTAVYKDGINGPSDFSANLSRLLPFVDRLSNDIPVVWTMQPSTRYTQNDGHINRNLGALNEIAASKL